MIHVSVHANSEDLSTKEGVATQMHDLARLPLCPACVEAEQALHIWVAQNGSPVSRSGLAAREVELWVQVEERGSTTRHLNAPEI